MVAVVGRIDGWWNEVVSPHMINREFSSVFLVLNLAGEPAVLAHRPGQLSLDNAFSLIEATRPPPKLRLDGAPSRFA